MNAVLCLANPQADPKGRILEDLRIHGRFDVLSRQDQMHSEGASLPRDADQPLALFRISILELSEFVKDNDQPRQWTLNRELTVFIDV